MRTKTEWKDNIKIYLKEVGFEKVAVLRGELEVLAFATPY
jgi:hypothetical protein